MELDLKNIHIGSLIKIAVADRDLDTSRICNFMKCDIEDIEITYNSKDINTSALMRWSKLLEFDFFRIYSHHLILYSPPAGQEYVTKNDRKSKLPQFKKNLYSRQLIAFVLKELSSNKKTKNQIIKEYNIPKTTLYNWISKYGYYINNE
ncbi:transposase [Chryseobacterium sp. Chry.R1]|uniref:transposase n=1 Tax=Chryseobacterium sp. Chry.R1 TaxID=3139392 RepID=UPI0031F9BE97